MGFWGLEVKPGTPQSYHPTNEQGKLHVTQATLGAGLGKDKSVIQCSIGDSTPVYLCSLLPNKNESCPLNLEFDDDDEPVEFSVTGNRSIHLTGFLESYDQEYEEDEDDSDGINIGSTDSEEVSDYDSEEEAQMDQLEDFLDSNLEMYRNASVPKSGVIIEEIEDEEKPAKVSKTKRPTKEEPHLARTTPDCVVCEDDIVDEDEDGLPVPNGTNKKRKAKASEQDGVQESLNKNKKKKNQKEKKNGETASNEEADVQVQTENVQKKEENSPKSSSTKAQNGNANTMNESSDTPDKSTEKKNKKKKKKKSSEEASVENKTNSVNAENQISDSITKGNKANSKPSQVRTYSNGLVVEELAMGKPDGMRADPGKQVRVRYIGKLQKNGKVFDSNIGKAPFKFRLGIGQVIKGWDVGVNGMRVGDKRRLTIPPAMGYGEGGAGGDIPPNAWLTFDVELIDVK